LFGKYDKFKIVLKVWLVKTKDVLSFTVAFVIKPLYEEILQRKVNVYQKLLQAYI